MSRREPLSRPPAGWTLGRVPICHLGPSGADDDIAAIVAMLHFVKGQLALRLVATEGRGLWQIVHRATGLGIALVAGRDDAFAFAADLAGAYDWSGDVGSKEGRYASFQAQQVMMRRQNWCGVPGTREVKRCLCRLGNVCPEAFATARQPDFRNVSSLPGWALQ